MDPQAARASPSERSALRAAHEKKTNLQEIIR
jgi:hypothetical protein